MFKGGYRWPDIKYRCAHKHDDVQHITENKNIVSYNTRKVYPVETATVLLGQEAFDCGLFSFRLNCLEFCC